MELTVKIGLTPKPNNLGEYEFLDVVSTGGSSYISLVDNNTYAIEEGLYWQKATIGAYDLAFAAGYTGTEAEFALALAEVDNKIDKTSVTNELGDSEELVMSQKGVTDELGTKANHGYDSSPKTLKEVDEEKANHGYASVGVAKTLKQVEDNASVKIKNEVVNGNFENGLIAPLSKSDGQGGESTLAINSSTPISGNYDIRFTITTPAIGGGRPNLRGLQMDTNIGDKIYLHFYAKILSGTPDISAIHSGASANSIYSGNVINGRNTRIIEVLGTSSAGLIYFNSYSVWDMQMDNFMRINLTETFGAGNEPTEEEMNLLLDMLPVDYLEGEYVVPQEIIFKWQLALIREVDDEVFQLQKGVKTEVQKLQLADTEQSHSIKAIEDTINAININQEATAEAEGYGTVSLPKNAANGGMSVKLEGQSAENLVTNGSMEKSTDVQWVGSAEISTIHAKTGVRSLLINSAAGVNSIQYGYREIPTTVGDLYILSGWAYLSVVNGANKYIRKTDGGGFSNSVYTNYNSELLNEWQRRSFVFTATASTTRIILGSTSSTPEEQEMYFDDIMFINLTATFGAGNEPTLEECDAMFADYFEGTANFLPTGRVRSVGKNLLNPFDVIKNLYVYGTSGVYSNSLTSYSTMYIPVKSNTYYIFSRISNAVSSYASYYDRDKNYISRTSGTSASTYKVVLTPANCAYINICWYGFANEQAMIADYITFYNQMQLEQNSVRSTYEPYTESSLYLQSPELRSNGAVKDEIRKGTNGYELVKRVGVGTLGSELILNGGFTTDTSNWTAVNSTLSVEDRMLKITNTAADFGYAYQSFATVIGKKYIVKLSHKNGTTYGFLRIATTAGSADSYSSPVLTDVNTTTRYATFVATVTTTYIRLVVLNGAGNTTFFDNASIKEFTESDGLSTGEIFTEFGSSANYTLATPVITPISYAGLLNSNSNGTVYHEPVIADAGVYDSGITVQSTNYPISEIEKIIKWDNGVEYLLDVADAVIAVDGLSFTHPDLSNGDLVMFTYVYDKESTVGKMTLTHYDSRYVIADTANGKFYKQKIVATNGVATIQLEEV